MLASDFSGLFGGKINVSRGRAAFLLSAKASVDSRSLTHSGTVCPSDGSVVPDLRPDAAVRANSFPSR